MQKAVREFYERIDRIRSDRIHGASFLTQEALTAFRKLAQSGVSRSLLSDAAVAIARSRPMMAPLFRVGNELLLAVESERTDEVLASDCDEISARMKTASIRASNFAADYIVGKRSILTHSYSTAVMRSLKRVVSLGGSPNLYCTESRPANEGRDLADQLCRAGLDTKLIIDAAAPFICDRVDLVVLGADGIGRFGVVHKIGTYAIALAAKESGAEVLVVADGMKFWPLVIKEVKEAPKPKKELSDGECFGALNLYFDITPLDYIDSIVTEDGVVNSKEVSNICKDIDLHPLLAI